MKEPVIAMVPSRLDAENVVSELRSEGFGTNDISVLFPDDTILVSVDADDAEDRAVALDVFERCGVKDATTQTEANVRDEEDDRPTLPQFR